MNTVTLQLPKTLYRDLEIQAEKEAIPLHEYIVYILSRQMPGEYTVRVLSEEDVARQETSFHKSLDRWGKITPGEVDEILAKRTIVEPETDLSPDVVRKLKARMRRPVDKRKTP